MLFDGITLAPGTTIANMRVEPMTSFPVNPFDGQQFELSVVSGAFQPGQYTYRNGGWQAVGGSGSGGTVDTTNLVTKTEAVELYALKTDVSALAQSVLTKEIADAAYASKGAVVNANMFILGTHIPGQPSLSSKVLTFIVPTGMTLAISTNFGGSKAVAGQSPTNNYQLSVRKNGEQISSIVFAANSVNGSLSAAASTLSAGDILTIVTSYSADLTIGDIGITLALSMSN